MLPAGANQPALRKLAWTRLNVLKHMVQDIFIEGAPLPLRCPRSPANVTAGEAQILLTMHRGTSLVSIEVARVRQAESIVDGISAKHVSHKNLRERNASRIRS